MSPSMYFERPHHLEFHDFTPGRQLPPAVKLILGLPYIFFQDPKPPPHEKAMEAFERLENGFNWTVYFAGENSSFKPKKFMSSQNCVPPSRPTNLDCA